MSEFLGMNKITQEKKEKMKEIINRLHKGESPEEVKEEFKKVVAKLKPAEIAILEGELIKEGLPAEEVHRLCDAHLLVFKESIERNRPVLPEWHPLFILMEEHKFMVELGEKIVNKVNEIKEKPDFKHSLKEIEELKELVAHMVKSENHYLREENVLFPYLEKHGISEPPKIMWMDHDQIRRYKKEFKKLLDNVDKNSQFQNFIKEIDAYSIGMLELIGNHFYKENNILFPAGLRVIEENEWNIIRKEFDEIGYCCYKPVIFEGKVVEEKIDNVEGEVVLPSGRFSIEELETVFNTLPIDITFIDKNDRVKYFSETPDRIFVRTRAIIGRTVQKCHPQKSVHIVDKILSDFKNKRRDHVNFWINIGDKLVYIRYFAVRDKKGDYLGTIEVSQDITDIKKIEGEKRIDSET